MPYGIYSYGYTVWFLCLCLWLLGLRRFMNRVVRVNGVSLRLISTDTGERVRVRVILDT